MIKAENKLDYLTYELKPGSVKNLPECVNLKNRDKSIHFIGLGGIGMSGIAKLLSEMSFKISGSDIKDSPTLFSMAERGATVFIGHDALNIEDAGLIVVSSAITRDNPEVKKALELNIPIIHRAQMLSLLVSGSLGSLSPNHVSIGVTGTHGKTTTSGMIGLMFDQAQMHPSIVVGGLMPTINSNSKLGSGQYFIAELDESDGTIVLYQPNITIITNLELDHADHYRNGFEQIMETFTTYINNLPDECTVIINLDSEGNRKLLERIPDNNSKILTYSIEEGSPYFEKAKFKAKNIRLDGFNSIFDAYYDNELFGEIKVAIPGKHNISNTLACVAVGVESGLGFEKVLNGISRFTGMRRRFQVIGDINDIKIIDDYAHHPTEIDATLSTAKKIVEKAKNGRVIAVFQPHRYSRLQTFWNEFTESLEHADKVFVTDVYAASERPIEGISSEKFVEAINSYDATYVKGSMDAVAEQVYDKLQPNDIVLTLGAGNITKLGNILIEKLERNN